MADFFRTNYWEFTHENDYHKNHNLKHQHSIHECKKEEGMQEETHVYPLFSGYKTTELD